jgi:hypothetical protein
VKTVLRSAARAPVQTGDRLRVTHDGGQLMVGSANVRTRISWLRDLQSDQPYLVFIIARDDKHVTVDPTDEYRVLEAGKLEGRMVFPNDPLESLTVSQITDEIREWTKAHGGI